MSMVSEPAVFFVNNQAKTLVSDKIVQKDETETDTQIEIKKPVAIITKF